MPRRRRLSCVGDGGAYATGTVISGFTPNGVVRAVPMLPSRVLSTVPAEPGSEPPPSCGVLGFAGAGASAWSEATEAKEAFRENARGVPGASVAGGVSAGAGTTLPLDRASVASSWKPGSVLSSARKPAWMMPK